MTIPVVGEFWGRGRFRKRVREVYRLSNGWYLIKTDNSKSERDFKVKAIFSSEPSRTMTPKHAHFVIDLYGKLCYDKDKALEVMRAIYDVWRGESISLTLAKYNAGVINLPGYPLEYMLCALAWILEQEDINFTSRPDRRQLELDEICKKQNVALLPTRMGSHLAMSVLCDICNGTHPVEALLKANLDIIPRKYGKM
ncbi:hypothetical protein IBX73_08465 [candidate division WOR-3 bacterium]|nr:hypothetical protein [candidate division WOR-3 bacterium]